MNRPARPNTAVCVCGHVERHGAGRSPPLGKAPALTGLLAAAGRPSQPSLSQSVPAFQVQPSAARGPRVWRASGEGGPACDCTREPYGSSGSSGSTWFSGVRPERWLGLLLAGTRVPSGSATRLL